MRCVSLFSLALLLSWAVLATPAGAQTLTYDLTFSPIEDEEMEETLAVSSNLLQLQDEPPPSIVGLVRRAEEDVTRLRSALRASGHYAGTVAIAIAGVPIDDPTLAQRVTVTEEPVPVRVEIRPGPAYRLASLTLVQVPPGEAIGIDRAELPLAEGDPARSADILLAEAGLVTQMKRQGHPFATVSEREAVVDHARQAMDLKLRLDPGPRATLGAVTIEGLERMDEDFVRRRIPFAAGEVYAPDKLERLRQRLTVLGVFASVRVVIADALAPDGSLPVRVTVVERPPRFVGFGVVYSTSEGLAVNGYWGHRNLFGQAERLRLEASAGGLGVGDFGDDDDLVDEIDYRVRLTFLKPDFLTTDQDLRVELQAVAERPEAFEREAIEGTVAIDRRLSDELTVGAGVTAVVERVRENEEAESETFTFIGLPLTAAFDTTDDPLDPTEGVRLQLATTPFPEFLGSSRDLLISRLDASAYTDFGSDRRFVLAGRTALGSILGGDDTLDVPASRRFYAGGGGSVRGYAFQSIGPEDAFGDPIGGRSLVEASLELRYRITDTIGIVPFIDAGAVFDSEFPDFSEDLQIGAGIGGRYYTGFGPLRLDVALPLNKREEDDAFAVYVSLGQAF